MIYILLKLVDLYTLMLVVYALLSWFPGAYDTSIGRFLNKACEPYLRLFDRFNLTLGNVDFTILVAIIVLNMLTRLLVMIA